MISGSKLMGEYNYTQKYAKYNRIQGRRETFPEAVRRMRDMHLERYFGLKHEDHIGHYMSSGELLEKVRPMGLDKDSFFIDVLKAFDAVEQKRLLGAQRALQNGGPAILKHNMRIYNCCASYINRPEFFGEALYNLLCGAGVGFSVQKHHIDELPNLRLPGVATRSYEHIIEDSIEGWACAVDALAKFFFGLGDYPLFDYSKIRSKGSPLSHGGFAPGHEPLKRAIEKIRKIFENAQNKGRRLKSIDAYDIAMHLADAVLSGGIRRAATICLFSSDDEDMITAKTGAWWVDNPQRGRSNNSMVIIRGTSDQESFNEVMKAVREFGEPGFIFLESTEHLYNPCAEAALCGWYITKDGQEVDSYTVELLNPERRAEWVAQGYKFEAGWQACNLEEINAAVLSSDEEFEEVCRYAALIGTLQAGYTDVGYLPEVSSKILKREALIGVSMTGIIDNYAFILNPERLERMAQVIIDENVRVAKILGINPATRTTCIKPAGNSTIILSEDYLMSSGITLHKAKKRMIRRVQAHRDDPVYKFFKEYNSHMTETCRVGGVDDDVIAFPIEIRPGALTIDDVGAIEFLEMVKLLQQHWVLPGLARDTSPGLCHNVSNTCTVRPEEWDEVGEYIWRNQEFFSGISLLGLSGDYMYDQAPMQRIKFRDDLVEEYGDLAVFKALLFFPSDVQITPQMLLTMKGIIGSTIYNGVPPSVDENPVLVDIMAKLFLINVKDSDAAIDLLVSIRHQNLWEKLVEHMANVDYTLLYEDTDNTKTSDAVACAGGACQI